MELRALVVFGALVACGPPPGPKPPLEPEPPPPRPPPDCKVADGWAVLRMTSQCADIRGGWSGYEIFEIRTGPARGKRVIAGYGDGRGASIGSNWSIGRVELDPTPTGGGWPNSCGADQDQPGPTYDGTAEPAVGYDDEATAKRALDHYCD